MKCACVRAHARTHTRMCVSLGKLKDYQNSQARCMCVFDCVLVLCRLTVSLCCVDSRTTPSTAVTSRPFLTSVSSQLTSRSVHSSLQSVPSSPQGGKCYRCQSQLRHNSLYLEVMPYPHSTSSTKESSCWHHLGCKF